MVITIPTWCFILGTCFLMFAIVAWLIGEPDPGDGYFNFPDFANLICHAANVAFWLIVTLASLLVWALFWRTA